MKRFLLLLLLFFPISVLALEMPEIKSSKAIIYDLTSDEIILEKNSEETTSIASLTKILTTITAIENIQDLEEEVVVTSNMLAGIYWNASVAGLKVGDVVTYRDLLYASMLPSGADATKVLAISITGSVDAFVDKMNELAQSIGMTNSHFVNVTGLDINNHYSTVKDVLVLLKYALDNELFKEIYTTREYILTNGLKVESTLNLYLKKKDYDTSRILGSKTGYTDNAGTCLSSLVNVQSHDMLIITVGAPFDKEVQYNLTDNLDLIDYMDTHYIAELPVISEDSVPFQLTLKNRNITINYEFIIAGVVIIILFPILVIPKKSKRVKRK